jgi:hypothetical protein
VVTLVNFKGTSALPRNDHNWRRELCAFWGTVASVPAWLSGAVHSSKPHSPSSRTAHQTTGRPSPRSDGFTLTRSTWPQQQTGAGNPSHGGQSDHGQTIATLVRPPGQPTNRHTQGPERPVANQQPTAGPRRTTTRQAPDATSERRRGTSPRNTRAVPRPLGDRRQSGYATTRDARPGRAAPPRRASLDHGCQHTHEPPAAPQPFRITDHLATVRDHGEPRHHRLSTGLPRRPPHHQTPAARNATLHQPVPRWSRCDAGLQARTTTDTH